MLKKIEINSFKKPKTEWKWYSQIIDRGNLLGYKHIISYNHGYYFHNDLLKKIEIIEHDPSELFFTTFILKGYSRGRSSILAEFISDTEKIKASMFISEFFKICELGYPVNKITGDWRVIKRGSNYSLSLSYLYIDNTNII